MRMSARSKGSKENEEESVTLTHICSTCCQSDVIHRRTFEQKRSFA